MVSSNSPRQIPHLISFSWGKKLHVLNWKWSYWFHFCVLENSVFKGLSVSAHQQTVAKSHFALKREAREMSDGTGVEAQWITGVSAERAPHPEKEGPGLGLCSSESHFLFLSQSNGSLMWPDAYYPGGQIVQPIGLRRAQNWSECSYFVSTTEADLHSTTFSLIYHSSKFRNFKTQWLN